MKRYKRIAELDDLVRMYARDQSKSLEGKLALTLVNIEEDVPEDNEFIRNSFQADYFTVFRLRKGNSVIRLNFKDYRISPGQLVVIGPDCVRQLISLDAGSVVESVVFTIDYLNEIKLGKKNSILIHFFSYKVHRLWSLEKGEDEKMDFLFARMLEKMDHIYSDNFGFELLRICFIEYLIELNYVSLRYREKLTNRYVIREDLVAKFIQLAQTNHLVERQLSFYADKLFVTSKHLSETVKLITGKTARQYIDYLNVIEAKRLLESTALPISDISDRLSFSSPAFFTKFFHRMEHKSPREYRKRYK
ncbi:helix-turn-helix domain-containing protein [Chryseobacterium sp. CT-SW4]|uniref:helix-turn-helix domain-containing protein n=1 Tax=Chryseobacterium sp. SW-1 TaxID=3157343 RepID=UPI003B017F91